VHKNPAQAQEFLLPMANHLIAAGLGSLSEIFDGDAPMNQEKSIKSSFPALHSI
jgi:hypothetical protein